MIFAKESLSECMSILEEVARRQDVIFYSDLAQKLMERNCMWVSRNMPVDNQNVRHLIGELSILCSRVGYPMISALVVSKTNSNGDIANRPGTGFYKLYKELKTNVIIPKSRSVLNVEWDSLWISECKYVYSVVDWFIVHDLISCNY